MASMKYIEVEWIDSCYHTGWQSQEDAKKKKVSRCTSVGYLIRSDKEQIIIAQGLSDGGSVGDMISIPRVAVRKVISLHQRKRGKR